MVSLPCRCSEPLVWMKMLILIYISIYFYSDYIQAARLDVQEKMLAGWGMKIGHHLRELGDRVTNFNEIQRGFSANAAVKSKSGPSMVKKMSADIEKMMAQKIEAVRRITDQAEQVDDSVESGIHSYVYNNAKSLNSGDGVNMTLTNDPHFYGFPVNISESVVHVPTNVYDKAADVIRAIKSSEKLNSQFTSNYRQDPSITWQYFCSSTGFLRQYPALKWDPFTTVDTYDCRMRLWYIEAATSPKDMVILMDMSGSMKGLKKEIAKHVALNILDTLNDDDFFTILKFTENITCLVECFNTSLVPASMENIREFKNALQNLVPVNVADFPNALNTSFNILHEFKSNGDGARCNQAIMLITDEAPHMYEDIFKQHNQPNRTVRIFTYQIGQELPDDRAVKWMACTNRGYYSHVSTIAEAREQVQHYVPVMARPLVLNEAHKAIWTSVYADIEDPKSSDFRWESLNKNRQEEYLILFWKSQKNENISGEENVSGIFQPVYTLSPPMDLTEGDDTQPIYRLMTTVAHPVFDKQNSSDRILGVAGTDVPIEDIVKLAPAYKLGVNGYAFAITNNGYILFHPDLRPVHYTKIPILKPDYNSVDLIEVEIADDNLSARDTNTVVLTLRQLLIDRNMSSWKMRVNIHLDDMRRVTTRTQHYFFAPLNATPFSFCIVLPENYGMNEVVGLFNISLYMLNLFSGNWTIHPNWIYCEYVFNNPVQAPGREDRLIEFLRLLNEKNFNFNYWEKPTHPEFLNIERIFEKNYYHCDRELLESLLFDANATRNHNAEISNRTSAAASNNVTLAFVATRSGLTRWTYFRPDDDDIEFTQKNHHAIDELWYKRAVDYYTIHEKTYVFSIDLNQASELSSEMRKVTATRAVFLTTNTSKADEMRGSTATRSAPAAVVGFRMDHSEFVKIVERHLDCIDQPFCIKACPENSPLSCYLLDDHGYVIYSRNLQETGRFYGKVNPAAMGTLVEKDIYRSVYMVDYQAVCPDSIETEASASFLTTPFTHIRQIFLWTWSRIMSFYINYHFFSWWSGIGNEPTADACTSLDDGDDGEPKPQVRDYFLIKSRPKPCDKQYYVYQRSLHYHMSTEYYLSRLGCKGPNDEPCEMTLGVTVMAYTNLLLVVVNTTCTCEISPFDTRQVEIKYDLNDTCNWLRSNIYRKRPEHCSNFHPQELAIQGYCGHGCRPVMQVFYGISLPVLVLVYFGCYTSV